MIQRFFSFAVIFCSCVSFADKNFAGHWQGPGQMKTGELAQAGSTQLDLTIIQTSNALLINDCWTEKDLNKIEQQHCFKSEYVLTMDQEIYFNNKKIGDLYPSRIMIFNGNAQASEQMIFDINGLRNLKYQYTFLTFDGQMSSRYGTLKEVP